MQKLPLAGGHWGQKDRLLRRNHFRDAALRQFGQGHLPPGPVVGHVQGYLGILDPLIDQKGRRQHFRAFNRRP